MKFIGLSLVVLLAMTFIPSCGSKYQEGTSEQVLVSPKADCGGDLCL